MSSKKEVMDELLKVPGARRAATGVILPLEDGQFLHVQGVHTKQESAGLSDDEIFFLAFCSRREILRMRSLRTSHDCLLRKRAQAIVDEPRLVRVFRRRRDAFEKSGRNWELTYYYHGLDHYHKRYLSMLPRRTRHRLNAVPAGLMLAKGELAHCQATVLGPIVVASEVLVQFFYFMTLGLLGPAVGVPAPDRIAATFIAVRTLIGTEALDFDLEARGDLPEPMEQFAGARVGEEMAFTFGHEYAHVLRRHLVEPTSMGAQAGVRASGDDTGVTAHDLEFEADAFALKSARGTTPNLQVLMQGGLAALLQMHVCFVILRDVGLGDRMVSDTHPPPLERYWRLWELNGRTLGIPRKHVQQAVAAAESLAGAIVSVPDVVQRLTFYGSVYLPTFKKKRQVDRIDY